MAGAMYQHVNPANQHTVRTEAAQETNVNSYTPDLSFLNGSNPRTWLHISGRVRALVKGSLFSILCFMQLAQI